MLAFKAALMAALPKLTKELKLSRKASNAIGALVGAAGAIPGAMNLRTYAKTPKR